MRRVWILVLAAALVAPACSSAGGGSVGQACEVVRWWADSSGAVAKPDAAPESRPAAVDLGQSAWPDDTAAADQFVQLYDDLSSDMSDSQYADEANAFEATSCA